MKAGKFTPRARAPLFLAIRISTQIETGYKYMITSGQARRVFKKKGKYAILKGLRTPRELKAGLWNAHNL